MVIFEFRLNGTAEAYAALNKINVSFPKWSKEFLQVIAKDLQKNARMRAPKATGFLRESIKVGVGDDKEIKVTVDAPYAQAQEFGFAPHLVPIEYIEMGLSNPGTRLNWFHNPSGFAMVSKHTPFMIPAFESLTRRSPKIAENFMKLKIKEVGFK